jgi:hypothetical protein
LCELQSTLHTPAAWAAGLDRTLTGPHLFVPKLHSCCSRVERIDRQYVLIASLYINNKAISYLMMLFVAFSSHATADS